MQELSQKNDDTRTCPHCGTENDRIPDLWLSSMGEGEQPVCSNCGKAVIDSQDPEISEGEEKGKPRFKVSFFIIAALLSGLVVYLNRTFDVLSFREDSFQIITAVRLTFLETL